MKLGQIEGNKIYTRRGNRTGWFRLRLRRDGFPLVSQYDSQPEQGIGMTYTHQSSGETRELSRIPKGDRLVRDWVPIIPRPKKYIDHRFKQEIVDALISSTPTYPYRRVYYPTRPSPPTRSPPQKSSRITSGSPDSTFQTPIGTSKSPSSTSKTPSTASKTSSPASKTSSPASKTSSPASKTSSPPSPKSESPVIPRAPPTSPRDATPPRRSRPKALPKPPRKVVREHPLSFKCTSLEAIQSLGEEKDKINQIFKDDLIKYHGLIVKYYQLRDQIKSRKKGRLTSKKTFQARQKRDLTKWESDRLSTISDQIFQQFREYVCQQVPEYLDNISQILNQNENVQELITRDNSLSQQLAKFNIMKTQFNAETCQSTENLEQKIPEIIVMCEYFSCFSCPVDLNFETENNRPPTRSKLSNQNCISDFFQDLLQACQDQS